MTGASERVVVPALLQHPFFEGFAPAFVRAISAKSAERRFEVDQLLAKEGTDAGTFYVVLEGKIALELGSADRPHLTVQTVGPGDVLGWSWLVPPHRWRFDARALKSSRVVALDAEVLRRTLRSDPTWGFQFLVRFLPVLAERLENARVQLMDLHAR